YLAIAAGAAMAAAMGLSGVLFADFGSRAYAAMALAAFAGGACGLVAHRLWRQPTRLARLIARTAIAAGHDAGEFVALHEDHLARQATVLIDPTPHRSRIDAPKGLR